MSADEGERRHFCLRRTLQQPLQARGAARGFRRCRGRCLVRRGEGLAGTLLKVFAGPPWAKNMLQTARMFVYIYIYMYGWAS